MSKSNSADSSATFSQQANLSQGNSQSQTDVRLERTESLLKKIDVEALMLMSRENIREALETTDALQMLGAVEEMEARIAELNLEKLYLYEFLEANDRKALIALRSIQHTHHHFSPAVTTLSRRSVTPTQQSGSRPSVSTILSSVSGSSSQAVRRNLREYHLNYRARIDMVESCIANVEARKKDFETRAVNKIRVHRARCDEMKYRAQEAHNTAINFRLHFLRDPKDREFLETASERRLIQKLRDYVTSWVKIGNALLGKMRLTIAAAQEKCQLLQGELLTKTDLNGLLGPADFELTRIKHDAMLSLFEEKTTHMMGLKDAAARASLALNQERKSLLEAATEVKRISEKTDEVVRTVDKISEDIEKVQDEIQKDREIIKQLKEKLERYKAPSIDDYMENKKRIIFLEKVEKTWKRKIDLSNMKLKNLESKRKASKHVRATTTKL